MRSFRLISLVVVLVLAFTTVTVLSAAPLNQKFEYQVLSSDVQFNAGADLLFDTTALQSRLNPRATPNYGTARLSGGFLPDPYTIEVVSGGSVDASYIRGCVGYVTSAPDVNVRYTNASNYISFYFQSSVDTTMIINDPTGDWYCVDDANGFNPGIAFTNPESGTYNIWIGSYYYGDNATGYLSISELQ